MAIPFTLRQLDYFVAVAEHGSVTAAAAVRNVAQPSVSIAVGELEAALGKSLFRRRPGQRLAITPAGRQLLIHARTALAAAQRIASGNRDRTEIKGEIAITCFRDIGAYYLPRLIAAFAARYPDVTFRLAEGNLAEVRTDIADGRCDLAITYDIELDLHGISRSTIHRLFPHALLPKNHRLARRSKVRLVELASERLVLEDFPLTYEYFITMFRLRGIEPPSVQLTPSFEMQRGLIANGWGVGLSCIRPKPDFSYDGQPIACRPLATAEPSSDIAIAHLGRETLTPPAAEFLASALKFYRNLSTVQA